MIQDKEIKIINNSDILQSTYKTNIIPELLKDKLEKIIQKEISILSTFCTREEIGINF